MAITVMDWAGFRGVRRGDDGSISMGEFDRVGLPMIGGCYRCGACISAGGACPTKMGYLACAGDDDGGGCVGDDGYDTVEECNRDNFPEEYEWRGVSSEVHDPEGGDRA